MACPMKYDYRVIFQRDGWIQPQVKIVHTEGALTRLVTKLRGNDRWDLAPLTRLDIYRRPVGDWEDYDQ